MKKLLLLIILFVTCISNSKAQNLLKQFAETDGKIIYESTVDVPGKNKDFLYFFSNKWLTNIPNNVQVQVTLADKDLGQINAIGTFKHAAIMGVFDGLGIYQFNIQIDVKDNKYRIRLYQILLINKTFPPDVISTTLEEINATLKKSNNESRQEKGAEVHFIFEGIISSLKDLIDKSANDDF